MLNEVDDDDTSFYIQKPDNNFQLKSVSGLNQYPNHSEQKISTNREPSRIVIREHQFSQYPINYDPSPKIIRKQVDQQHQSVVYKQQIAVRYLCPPTPPPPAPLIIREIRAPQPDPLPPIIIRQRPPPPPTPPPIIIRERPPTPPALTTPQIIYKQVPYNETTSTRRVIIERLPALPAKPPNIIVERWLPYKQQKRQVIYEKSFQPNANRFLAEPIYPSSD